MKIIRILIIAILALSIVYHVDAQEGIDSKIIRINATTFLKETNLSTAGKRILSPSMKEEFEEGDYIMFSCCGITGDLNEYTTYLWESDIDGIIGKERYFSVNNLSVGRHHITLKIYKPDGKIATDSVTIIINKKYLDATEEIAISKNLVASILSPKGYPAIYYEGVIEFRASAMGGTPPYSYRWVSGIDGLIGEREEFHTRNLSIGNHEITLNVRDSKGLLYTKSISLPIIKKSQLSVSITSPGENARYIRGDNISMRYSISGGRKPYTLTWMLDNETMGEIIRNITPGMHSIRLIVTDADGDSRTYSVDVDVTERCNRNTICEWGENYMNCPQDCSGARDGYCDKLTDGICDQDCKREDDADCLCNNNAICETNLENHANCPIDCRSGSNDNYCDGVKDGICDPDCKKGGDKDCKLQIEYSNYLILLILVIFIIIVYLKLVKK